MTMIKFGDDTMMEQVKHQLIFIFFLFMSAAFLIYFPTLNAPFQFDDYEHIVRNSAIKHFPDLGEMWNYDSFRFITYLSFSVNYALDDLQVKGYHAVSLILHASSTFVLLLISSILASKKSFSKKLSQNTGFLISLFSAILFLVHPIQTQAVSYLSQRATVLAAFFYLLSTYLYLYSREKESKRHFRFSIFFAVCAMFSKQIGVTLPFFILLIELFFYTEKKFEWKKVLPFLFLVAVIPAAYISRFGIDTLSALFSYTQEARHIPRAHYLFTQFPVILTYLKLIIYPVGLNVDYDFPIYSTFFHPHVALSFFAIATFFLVWFKSFRNEKIIVFSLSSFILLMVPESSIFSLSDVIFEHRLYLPMSMLSIAIVATLFILFEKRKFFIHLCIDVMIVFALLSFARSLVWSDPIHLMKDVVSKSPEKARPHNNLGYFYLMNQNDEEAKRLFERAVQLDPNYAPAVQNLGSIYYEGNNFEVASGFFLRAANLDTSMPEPWLYLGHIFYEKKDFEKAEEAYKKSLEANPSFEPAFNGLANVYLEQKDWHAAYRMAKRSERANPDNANTHYLLGNLSFMTEEYAIALREYQKTLKLDPKSVHALNNLGNLYFRVGNLKEAKKSFEEILQIDPTSEMAYFNLANVCYEIGDLEEAENHFQKASRLAQEKGNRELIRKIKSEEKKRQ